MRVEFIVTPAHRFGQVNHYQPAMKHAHVLTPRFIGPNECV